ncbi:MAG: twin-arginine translocase TatA/TatE family subunit [Verrucomicrobiales bacterium]|nr:twin-arginine translocase TatA/TatE family subunit [Verrucomicrobiales bacterium]
MILIALVILLLFGAKKLPELARGIGKSMGEFKKAKEDFEDEIKRGTDEGTNPPKSTTPAPSQTVAQSNDDEHSEESGDEAKAEAEEKKAETAV